MNTKNEIIPKRRQICIKYSKMNTKFVVLFTTIGENKAFLVLYYFFGVHLTQFYFVRNHVYRIQNYKKVFYFFLSWFVITHKKCNKTHYCSVIVSNVRQLIFALWLVCYLRHWTYKSAAVKWRKRRLECYRWLRVL